MTTLRRHESTRDVRCDRCGWRFFVVAARFQAGEWYEDPELDAHLCPGCARQGELTDGERAILQMRPGRPGPLGRSDPAGVFLAMDDTIRRKRLADLIRHSGELRLLATGRAGAEWIRAVADHQPHLLVLEPDPDLALAGERLLQGIRYRSPYTLVIGVARWLDSRCTGPTPRVIPDRCLPADASPSDLFYAALEVADSLRVGTS